MRNIHNPDDSGTIIALTDRAMSLLEPSIENIYHHCADIYIDEKYPDLMHGQLQRDLESVLRTCPDIDLQKMLDFDDFNFAHDLLGIIANLDRADGYPAVLTNCFLPRCASHLTTDHPSEFPRPWRRDI
tara:strand:- start:196 stop:582 length:387 start_codon:yes stop_codon:yes gene_type:complete